MTGFPTRVGTSPSLDKTIDVNHQTTSKSTTTGQKGSLTKLDLQTMDRSTNLTRMTNAAPKQPATVPPPPKDDIKAESYVTASKAWNLKGLFLQSGQRMIAELKKDPTVKLTDAQHKALDQLSAKWQTSLDEARANVADPKNQTVKMTSDSKMEAICPESMPKQLYKEAQAIVGKTHELPDRFRDAFIRTTNDKVPWVAIHSEIQVGGGEKFQSTLTPVNKEFDPHFAKYETSGLSSNAPRLTERDPSRFEGSRATNLWQTEYQAEDGTVLFSAFRSGCLGAKGTEMTEKATCAKQNSTEVLTAMVVQKLKEGATDPIDLKVLSINLQSGGKGGEGEMILYQTLGLESAAKDMTQQGVNITLPDGTQKHVDVNVTLVQARAASNHVGFVAVPGQKAANEQAFDQLRQDIGSRDDVSTKAEALWDAVQRTGKESTGGFKLASRLAVLGHELGYQVHFNCMSGKDRTGLMDTECKVLAHRMHEGDGSEVPFALKTDEDRALFNKMLFEGGSQKVTEHNTGIQAFKVDPFWVFEEGTTGLYSRLGGSEDSRNAVLGGIRYTIIDKW